MTFSDETLFKNSLFSLILIAPPTFISLRFLQAPYGKHYRQGWGPSIPPSLAWFLMESPTIWLTLLIYPLGQYSSNPRSIALISVYLLHYINRAIIYPLRLRNNTSPNKTKSKPCFPISIALMAFGFNFLNAYLQSRWVSHYGNYAAEEWWFWGRFLIGLLVFVCGMVVNVRSDLALVKLKGEGGGYKIPRGGMFEKVSCANYFGEIVEWLGWAVMSWSWAGFGFFLYACANLVPRGRANHLWYREKFEDYPESRKAVVPFVY